MDEMLLTGAEVSLMAGDDPGERPVLFPDLKRSFDRASLKVDPFGSWWMVAMRNIYNPLNS